MTETLSTQSIALNTKYKPLLKKLGVVFNSMDLNYKIVAEHYGFKCVGCKNSCCSTVFYHHTLVEYLYIIEGFNSLPTKDQNAIDNRVILLNNQSEHHPNLHVMCPFNIDNRCSIYEYRPMICRLHGIPYELHYPNTTTSVGPGCHKFKIARTSTRLNRTPLYKNLAALELEMRKMINFHIKIKMTITEMLTHRHSLK